MLMTHGPQLHTKFLDWQSRIQVCQLNISECWCKCENENLSVIGRHSKLDEELELHNPSNLHPCWTLPNSVYKKQQRLHGQLATMSILGKCLGYHVGWD